MRAWLQHRIRPSAQRWWVALPQPEETIESVLERTCHVYHGIDLSRAGWVAQAVTPAPQGVGGWRCPELAHLVHLLGVPASTIFAARVPDTPATLAPAVRRAYCARCWLEDDAAHRPRHFRGAWAQVLRLLCHVHDEPLAWAAHPLFDLERHHVEPYDLAAGSEAHRLIHWIQEFADTLGRHLFEGAPWPARWHLSAYQARALLCHGLGHLEGRAAPAASQSLWPGPGPARLYRTRRPDLPPWRGSPWEAVRHAGPPAWRLVALWMAAAHTRVTVPPAFTPDGTHGALRSELSRCAQPERAQHPGRRLTRLRQALEADRMAWLGEEPASYTFV